MMKYEKTQKGNPHQLTVNQHVFPSASIQRFVQEDGKVFVYLIQQDKEIEAKPENQLFCAKRVWNQKAETGYMKSVENKYQRLAKAVIEGKVKTFNPRNNSIVTDMYLLWKIRAHMKENSYEDIKVNVPGVSFQFSKDEQEELEKAGVMVVRPD